MDTDWLEAKELRGPHLCLVPLSTDDAAEFRAALGEPDEAAQVLAHLAYPPPTEDETARRAIEDLLDHDDRVVYAQRLRATDELVGVTSFYEISPSLRALAIGQTWIARRHWRTGVNTESKLLMLTRAFDELGAERVVWHTDIRNLRSQTAIERLGATREGVLRHHKLRRDGSWRDTVQYSMLSREWPEARQRLEGWMHG